MGKFIDWLFGRTPPKGEFRKVNNRVIQGYTAFVYDNDGKKSKYIAVTEARQTYGKINRKLHRDPDPNYKGNYKKYRNPKPHITRGYIVTDNKYIKNKKLSNHSFDPRDYKKVKKSMQKELKIKKGAKYSRTKPHK